MFWYLFDVYMKLEKRKYNNGDKSNSYTEIIKAYNINNIHIYIYGILSDLIFNDL